MELGVTAFYLFTFLGLFTLFCPNFETTVLLSWLVLTAIIYLHSVIIYIYIYKKVLSK